MKRNDRKNDRAIDTARHKAGSLFTEWPTPSDTVEGFGGEPDKAPHRQWQPTKSAPDSK